MCLSYRVFAGCVVLACLVGSCSNRAPTYPGSAMTAGGSAAPVATAMRGGELGTLTARGLVDALNRTGYAAPRPLDTTAQECPTAGCEQSIVTDTLRVKSFASTARAQSYAATQGLFQMATIVVAFAPPLTQPDRDRYLKQIEVLLR